MNDKVTKFEADVSAINPALELMAKMYADGLDPGAMLNLYEHRRDDGTLVVYFWMDIHIAGSEPVDLDA